MLVDTRQRQPLSSMSSWSATSLRLVVPETAAVVVVRVHKAAVTQLRFDSRSTAYQRPLKLR